jgi:signal transduction histidine kinase
MRYHVPVRWRRVCFGLVAYILGGFFAFTAEPMPPQPDLPLLTRAAQVRQLSREEAQRGYPVHLRGVVTYYDDVHAVYYDRKNRAIFFHDFESSVYVAMEAGATFAPGDLLDLEGRSGSGQFAPVVLTTRVKSLGRAPLPAPKPVIYEQLATGRENSQWVQIAGVVRSVELRSGRRLYITVVLSGGGRIGCSVSQSANTNTDWLVNATVRVNGVCFGRFNENRQLRAPWLGVTSLDDIHVEKLAPTDLVEVPIAQLLLFNSQAVYGERVKVRGVVTLLQNNESLFIRENSLGLHVKTSQATPVKPGDIVEVTGFSALGQFKPSLEDAIYRRVGESVSPVPLKLNAEAALTGEYDADLVRIEARLLNRVKQGDEQSLVLQDRNSIFNAYLADPGKRDRLASLRDGSRVELTGICLVQKEESWNPSAPPRIDSFHILLRTPQDITVFQQPSWWTLSRLLWTLVILGLIVLASFAWVLALRKRVQEQMGVIEQKVQREVMVEERTRIAADLHDEIGSSLWSILLLSQMAQKHDAMGTNERRDLAEINRIAQQTARSIRDIVWFINPEYDTVADLVLRMKDAAATMLAGIEYRFEHPQLNPGETLSLDFRQNILLIFKESLTNIVKHSGATRVDITFSEEHGSRTLSIQDNGAGFNTQTITSGTGLKALSRRAARLGGTLEIVSEPGHGTIMWIRIGIGPPK